VGLSSPAVVDVRSAIITASVLALLTTLTPHSLPFLPPLPVDAPYS
jgi:hypothetical protein